jgi:tetrahydromethanopterin S-methyltransferase subunit A
MDSSGRIIRAVGPNPIVTLPQQDVDIFRHQVEINDMIGTVDIGKIAQALVT